MADEWEAVARSLEPACAESDMTAKASNGKTGSAKRLIIKERRDDFEVLHETLANFVAEWLFINIDGGADFADLVAGVAQTQTQSEWNMAVGALLHWALHRAITPEQLASAEIEDGESRWSYIVAHLTY